MSEPSESELDRILAEPVYSGTAYKPFAEMTAAEVEARAAELRSAAGFGTQRVASVASVWEGLAEVMRASGAATVADVARDDLRVRAGRLWVVPPGGSFLS